MVSSWLLHYLFNSSVGRLCFEWIITMVITNIRCHKWTQEKRKKRSTEEKKNIQQKDKEKNKENLNARNFKSICEAIDFAKCLKLISIITMFVWDNAWNGIDRCVPYSSINITVNNSAVGNCCCLFLLSFSLSYWNPAMENLCSEETNKTNRWTKSWIATKHYVWICKFRCGAMNIWWWMSWPQRQRNKWTTE